MEGKTPFVLAILRPDDLGDAFAEVMLAHGAHPYQRLSDGYTPLDKARWYRNSSRVGAIEGWLLDTSILWSLQSDRSSEGTIRFKIQGIYIILCTQMHSKR